LTLIETRAAGDAGGTGDVGEPSPPIGDERSSRPRERDHRGRRADLTWGGITGALAAFVAALVYEPWGGRLRIPFAYSGDAIQYATLLSSADFTGSIRPNAHLGAPYALTTSDFPQGADRIHIALVRLLMVIWRDPLTAMNAYLLASFVLVAVAAFVALRLLGLRRPSACVMSVLYAFLPYHFAQGTTHLTLAAYFSVPFAVVLAVFAATGRLGPAWDLAKWRSLAPRDRRALGWAVGAAVVIGSSNAYYAVFGLVLCAALGAIAATAARRAGPFVAGLSFALLIGLAVSVNLAPELLSARGDGRNVDVAARSVGDSDLYGLRLSQMVLPSPTHRVAAMRRLGVEVSATGFAGEPDAYLGLVADVGLVALGVWALRALRRRSDEESTFPSVALAGAAVTSFMVATVGGVSVVIAAMGFTQIRVWSRAVVVVAFIGLAGAGRLVELAWARWAVDRRRATVGAALGASLLVLGLLDQIGLGVTPRYTANRGAQESVRDFVTAMGSALPAGARVFQLPYMSFPNPGWQVAMAEYDPFRAYLASPGDLAWSYGAMRGREGDWQRSWSLQATPVMVTGLAAAGFDALYVDRFGYSDGAAQLEAELAPLLGPPHDTSRDGRLAWFDLRPLRTSLADRNGNDELSRVGRLVVRPVGYQLPGATFVFGDEYTRVVGRTTTLTVRRYDSSTEPMLLSFRAAGPVGSTLTLDANGTRTAVLLTTDGAPVQLVLPMASRSTSVRLWTDAPNSSVLGDMRTDARVTLTDISCLDAGLQQMVSSGSSIFAT
jgi:phosphoglycerol transferase